MGVGGAQSSSNRGFFSTRSPYLIVITAALVWLILNISHYQILRQEVFEAGEDRVAEVLRIQSAIHQFVESDQKPAVYSLMTYGELGADWFDPRILSGTYIARRIQEEVNEERIAEGWSGMSIKLAAVDARNPVNEADEAEADLLAQFNAGTIDKVTEFREQDGHAFFYAAIPMFRNGIACVRCHGKPEDAPADLIKQYGSERAFNRKLGEIPALISVRVPMDKALEGVTRDSIVYAGGSGALIGVVASLLVGFVRQLDGKNRQLDALSQRDALTGLFNRRAFNERLESEIDRASRYGKPFTLVMADIDHFKRINDEYGHLAGDRVLAAFGQLLSAQSRQSDLVARWGGEEFAMLLPETDLGAGREHAESLRRKTEELSLEDDIRLTASLGVAEWQAGESARELVNRLDIALYAAKDGGRNRVEVAHRSLT